MTATKIRCAHCKSIHDSIRKVRLCAVHERGLHYEGEYPVPGCPTCDEKAELVAEHMGEMRREEQLRDEWNVVLAENVYERGLFGDHC